MRRVSDRWAFRVGLVTLLVTQFALFGMAQGLGKGLQFAFLLMMSAAAGALAVLEWAGYFEWRARNAGKPTQPSEPPVGHADDVARLYPAPWHCRNAGADLERVSGATVIEDADGRVVLLLPHYRTEPSIERAQRLGEWIVRATNKQAAHE